MSLIDKYIYAVTKTLPQKQREDIAREIRTLIDDMLEQEQGDESEETKVKKVLLDLGDPELLADSYRESKRYLIGPQNFDTYLLVMKIVFGAVFAGISIATVVGSFFDNPMEISNIITDYIGTLFFALLQAFAWVTAAFGLSEYYGVEMKEQKSKKDWSITDLPEVPQKAAMISKADAIAGILFSTIFTSLLYFAPQFLAAYVKNSAGELMIIPVFNIQVLFSYKTLIVVIFILGVLKEILKLMIGRWNVKLSVALTIINTVSLIFTLVIFANPATWNGNFIPELMQYFNMGASSQAVSINIPLGIIAVMVIAYGAEIGSNLYKGFKYNR